MLAFICKLPLYTLELSEFLGYEGAFFLYCWACRGPADWQENFENHVNLKPAVGFTKLRPLELISTPKSKPALGKGCF